MKRITLISAVFPPEPVVSAKLSYDIAFTLSEKNIVTVISPKPSRPYEFQFTSKKLRFDFIHIQFDSYTCASSSFMGRFRESYSFGKHCYRYVADNHKNIDIIYANIWAVFGQYFVVKAAKKYNIPIILHVQDIYPESLTNKLPVLRPFLNFILLPIDKYVLHNATRVIAISDKMKNYLLSTRKIDSGKVAVVQNWQDEDVFTNFNFSNKILSNKNRPFTFMYLGNIGPVAGNNLLIEAFANADLQNSRLVIAGSGSMKESLKKKATKLNLNTIEFWPVPDGKVPEIQEQADVMLLPIKKGAARSSIPSKLPAYMFSAKPIIACVDENSDTATAINEAKCGWVIEPENINRLTELIKKIKTFSPEELSHKGKNGFDYALHNFSKKNNLQKTISVINKTSKR